MRPGLVAVGVSFIAVVAVSATSIYLWPDSPSSHSITTDVPPTSSIPNQTQQTLLEGTNATSAKFTVAWQSSAPVWVVLYHTPTCGSAGPSCSRGNPICNWRSNLSGSWSVSGDLSFPYLLVWTSQNGQAGSFQAQAQSSAEVSTGPPAWASASTMIALAALASVGAIALFLGIFLHGGLYGTSRASSVSHASERPGGTAEPGPSTAPRTGTPDGGDGPPRRGPPSPDR